MMKFWTQVEASVFKENKAVASTIVEGRQYIRAKVPYEVLPQHLGKSKGPQMPQPLVLPSHSVPTEKSPSQQPSLSRDQAVSLLIPE